MPAFSKDTAPKVEDFGPAVDHQGELDGYTAEFVTIREGHSLAADAQGPSRRQLPVPALGLPVRRQPDGHLCRS